MSTPRMDPLGCHGDPPEPLHQAHPDKFPGQEIPYCPWRIIREQMDPWAQEVLDLYRDYSNGVIAGWPRRYTAAVVDAIRLVERESAASISATRERR